MEVLQRSEETYWETDRLMSTTGQLPFINIDLSYNVGGRQYGKLLVHWMHVYVKVKLIMLVIERAQWPKQACQARQASVCLGYSECGES
uniref:Uncharacterized protein n=1 Tax=Cynoglossus semilaevis TaxID=244447 RepID=A0A3P8UV39_CYNSE